MELAGANVAVIGGGIGGLAAALCLKARGAQVSVLEQAAAIREVGAGIQVSPNGFRVLDALGLGAAFRGISVPAAAVVLHNFNGRPVLRMDLGRSGRGEDYRFVHRADLIDLLAAEVRARGITLRLSQEVTGVTPGARPRITFASGDALEADVVLGADGLHSVVRRALNGTAAPFFTGQVAWRAVVPNVIDHPCEAWVHMGPGRHMVSYPLRGGEVVNLVAVEERRAWVDEGWSQVDDAANLQAAFAGLGGAARRLVEAVEQPGLWGLFRHPVARVWHGERVALAGDAAHPTLPFLAQGANMALEDAFAFGAALGAHGLDAGPEVYQGWRRERAARVIAAANGNAWKYHLRNPLVRGVAHLGLGVVGRLVPERMIGQFDWIYEYDVTRLQ